SGSLGDGVALPSSAWWTRKAVACERRSGPHPARQRGHRGGPGRCGRSPVPGAGAAAAVLGASVGGGGGPAPAALLRGRGLDRGRRGGRRGRWGGQVPLPRPQG